MRDEFDDRIHQALRADFAANIAAIARSVAVAFDRLHERLYGAPWSTRTSATGEPCPTRLTTR
jgi:hypothetical protein